MMHPHKTNSGLRMTPWTRLRGLSAGSAALVLSLLAGVAGAADAPKGPTISRSISKELSDGQKALQAGQFAEGLKHLEAAEAVTPLTPFDHKTIDELKAYAYGKMNNYKSAGEAYEAAIATGATTPEETLRYEKAVFQVALQLQQYPKAIEYGKKLIDADAANADTYAMITQVYYLQKDCKDAIIWADKSIAFVRKAGETPKENLYQFKLSCAFDSNDIPATKAVLEDLIRLNGKTDYWNKLLRFELQDEKDDRNSLMIYRIMYNTNSMSSGGYYVEMAQLLADAPALPGEAEAVLEKGIASGTIGADQKDRVTRLQGALKTRADADKKGLPEFATEAAKSASGDLSVKLGEVYYGFGDYQNAVTAINAGLAKGGVKHFEDAYVYLGLSEEALKNIPEAKKAFAQLKTVPNVSPKLLPLWQLYAERLGT
jgi:tetratricopeptide (TPR) repeat protein